MEGQVTEIKAVSRFSATKAATDTDYGNLFDLIIRRVTLKAIDKINTELEEVDERGQAQVLCGCFLRRTYGLPCACELQIYITYGESIPLSAVDEYWKKIYVQFPTTESPSTSQRVSSSNPGEEGTYTYDFFAPPVVTKKDKKKKGRIPSAWESVMKFVGMKQKSPRKKGRGRVAGISASQGSAMSISQGRGRSTPSNKTTDSSPDTPSSRQAGSNTAFLPRLTRSVRYSSTTTFPLKGSTYEPQFPPFIRPYIDKYTDVDSDGHCGFRAVAKVIYNSEKEWGQVRFDLLEELHATPDLYGRILGGGPASVAQLEYRLSWWNTPAPYDRWMEVPECGHLIASRYNVVFVSFADLVGITCLPAHVGPEGPPKNFLVLGNVGQNSHWILLHMHRMDYPIPPISFFWPTRHDSSADGIELPLQNRIEDYNELYNRDAPRRATVLQSHKKK